MNIDAALVIAIYVGVSIFGFFCLVTLVFLVLFVVNLITEIRERHAENRKRIGGWW